MSFTGACGRCLCILALGLMLQALGAPPQASPQQSAEREIDVDFSVRSDPPLLKKFSMFNAGHVPIASWESYSDQLAELYAHAMRLEVGIGGTRLTGARRYFSVDAVQGTPDDLQFNFAPLDRWVEIISRQNVVPYFSWGYIPTPLRKNGARPTLNTDVPDWPQVWKRIYAEYARHFRQDGLKLAYHEVYNEPDGGGFLNHDQFKSGVYLQLYKYGVLGLREGDPEAVVGGPGYADGRLLGDFVAFVRKENLPLDFLSFHTYLGYNWPEPYQTAREALASDPRFSTTEIHLNEFNPFPDRFEPTSLMRQYQAAARALTMISDIVGKVDITYAFWSQFMRDSHGLISEEGHKRAAFQAFKIYADMPEQRVAASATDPAVRVMGSTDGHRAAAVVWCDDPSARTISVKLNRLPFTAGEVRMYRVDRNHASYFDGAPEDLRAEKLKAEGRAFTWTGELPGFGVLYFVADDGSAPPDFQPNSRDVKMGTILRTHHYFEYGAKQPKTSYRFFDRRSWRAFLGMGSENLANSICGVTAENLPAVLDVRFRVGGNIHRVDQNSLLGLRVDYVVGGQFVRSVLFHGGIYSAGRDSAYPFGTKRAPDQVINADLSQFQLRMADHAPEQWKSGRVLISFQMRNTGPGTRSEITIRPGQ